MSRPRTADDKLMALLARMPAPLEVKELAAHLRWSRERARQVAFRLRDAGRVAVVPGAAALGRPPLLVSLPEQAPAPGVEVMPAPLAPHTVVVTPSGEEARVIRMHGRSHAEFEYITGPERFQRGELHISLLRPFQPGRDRPEPARVKEAA